MLIAATTAAPPLTAAQALTRGPCLAALRELRRWAAAHGFDQRDLDVLDRLGAALACTDPAPDLDGAMRAARVRLVQAARAGQPLQVDRPPAAAASRPRAPAAAGGSTGDRSTYRRPPRQAARAGRCR